MAITWVGKNIECLSSDTKPTNVPTNTQAFETNTDDTYRYNGTAWVLYRASTKTETLSNKTIDNDSNSLINIGYNVVIYKSGSTYKAKSAAGATLASSTTLNGVVQTALDNKGTIWWPAASDGSAYTPTSGLTGWELSSNTSLIMGYNTRITVPETFSGTVFKINDAYGGAHVAYHISIQGGSFQQAGAAPDANWTWMLMESSSSTTGDAGVGHVSLRDIYVKRCNRFIVLKCDTGSKSWINGNNFDNIWCDYPHEGIVFNQTGAVGTSIQAINRNNFNAVVIQADPGAGAPGTQYEMLYGIKNISGVNNVFTNCKIWDVVAPNISSNITNKAENTIINGGLMVQQPYDWEMSQNFGLASRVDGTEKSGGFSVGAMSALSNPFIRKMGQCHATGTSGSTILGDGLLSGFNVAGAGTYTTPTPTANGHFKRADCTTTATTVAGFRSGSTISCRNFGPVFAIRFKLNGTTNQRVFIGFASSTAVTLGTSDDPLASLTGFGLYHSTTHGTSPSNWLTCTNTGSASSTFANTTLAANNTNVHKVYIAGWEDGPKWQWRLDDTPGQLGDVTATIPGQFTQMTPGIWISNGAASQANTVDFFGAYLKHTVREGG